MKIDGSAIRPGMVLEMDKRLWLVTRIQIGTPGNLRSFNQVDMKDIQSGNKSNKRFASNESVERVRLDEQTYQFLYAEGELLTFMDQTSYEQIQLPKELLGDSLPFLQDGMEVSIQLYEEKPLSVTLPEKVTLEIAETEPTVKGQTASSSYKPATLSNGVRTLVPPFIEAGTKIVVMTADASYVERAKAS